MDSSRIAQKTFELENQIQVHTYIPALAWRDQKPPKNASYRIIRHPLKLEKEKLIHFGGHAFIISETQPLEQDKIFRYNADEQKAIQKEARWKKDPHYFKKVKVSGVALIKMVSSLKLNIYHQQRRRYNTLSFVSHANFNLISFFFLLLKID
jgi:hypothetical protein